MPDEIKQSIDEIVCLYFQGYSIRESLRIVRKGGKHESIFTSNKSLKRN